MQKTAYEMRISDWSSDVFSSDRRSLSAVLFFDECDALFGKRGDIKEARDRWANLEVNHLLVELEAHDGVVILATNLRRNLDEAFRSEEHTSELQSLMRISYAVFCLKKQKTNRYNHRNLLNTKHSTNKA